MKHLIALASLFFAVAAFADDVPKISVVVAADAAQKDLASRDLLKSVYIESVTLTRPAVFNGESFWYVKWSHPIILPETGKREVGVNIRMDGTLVRVVASPGKRIDGVGLQAGPTLQYH